jgi:hypothetical protein
MERRAFLARALPLAGLALPVASAGTLAALLRPHRPAPAQLEDQQILTAEWLNDLAERVVELEHR